MVAAGLSTEAIQEYLDNPDADASDSDDGGESIGVFAFAVGPCTCQGFIFPSLDYINDAPVPIEDEFMPLATYSTAASQTLWRLSGLTQSSPIMSQACTTQASPGKHRETLSSPGPEHIHRGPNTPSGNETAHQDNVAKPNRTHKRLHDDLTDTDTRTSTPSQIWASGRHVKGGAFSEALFHDVYICHLKGLEAWRSFNAKSAKSLTRLKENLHDNGSLHARLLILQDDPKPHFNMTKFSLATQAIESSDED
ncbi:hypothetical protein JB92DRAFT_3164690 [Gautieria morchelliformis]|nr:hypothetical protein JB92DRAFT_3164690 [Gautieria morchelliformis]